MRYLILLISLLVSARSYGQMTVSGQVSPGETLTFNVPFDCWYYDALSHTVTADADGHFRIELPVTRAQTIFLDRQNTRLHLYAEPGRTLHLMQTDSLRFSGQLGKENEFRRKTGLMDYLLGEKTWNDTLSNPEDIRKILDSHQAKALSDLQSASPGLSEAFIAMTRADIRYFTVSKIRDLMWSTGVKLTGENKSRFDLKQWKSTSNRAHEAVSLSDSSAVNSYHYQIMVANYKYHLEEKYETAEEFKRMAEKIFQKPFEEVNKEVRNKGKRYWDYKLITYSFEGLSLQYALASFITNGILQGDLEYLAEAYRDFTGRFPDSRYLPHVKQVMKPYLESTENSGTRFVTENLPDLSSIINQFKGKVLYIDLWGTWCGPCRQEFAFNQALKQNFSSGEVAFLYVAVEHSPDPVKKWKETVNFFNLSGQHILAGKALEEDLRKRYGQDGMISFPSYILVDKSGSIITLHAKRPSDKEELYEQIRKLL